ncbi:Ion transport protein-domain-containing protein [Thamnocephalis sphaerospora]|uniref:Calcium-channel protein CCH1 n=1 Tax=Thamnocephalis sphaerospora TaxID=78915 RepID=A0A4P9XRQ5_9FUNG|nr:Ion transport protein-domain-containing protein [Thamnocephalis sphaerospora]|eukprot:RKP08010.1 Ion transport protein-domain-containing protein [Thamnocephalis sphaerospora]
MSGRGTRKPALRPPHNAYLRHTFNRIDFLAVVAFWLDFAFMLSGVDHFPLFKGIAALRPVRLLVITSGLATIMRAIKISMPLLANVVGFIGFFVLLFGLIALQTFKGTLVRRCEMIDGPDAGAISAPEKFCGSHRDLSGRLVGINEHISAKGYTCPASQQCVDTQENPHHGYIGYDNILYAVFTIFNSVSTEGWTETMYWTMDAEYALAALYHCMLILSMSFIIMQLFVAVITESFADTRSQSNASTFLGTRMDHQLLQYDGNEARAAEAAAERMGLEQAGQTAYVIAAHAQATVAPVLTGMCANLSRVPAETAEAGFTAYFAVEILVRMVASATWRTFWASASNRTDLFLAIATSIVQLPFIRQVPWYRYLTIFPLMRFYRVVPLVPRVNTMAAKMFRSIKSFMNVIFFMAMTLTIASTVSMQVFSGRFDFEDSKDDSGPKRNFDSFGEAFLALFQILSGENWNEVLYNAMRSQTGIMVGIAGIFIIIFYWFSHYVIANLFVAVLLENFEMDTKAKRALQITQFLEKQEQHDHYSSGGLLSKLNPYMYMKPKPRLLRVNNMPKGIVAQVRKSLVRRLLSGADAARAVSGTASCATKTRPLTHFRLVRPNRETNQFNLMKKASQRGRAGSVPQLDARAAREAEFREAFPTYERSMFMFYPNSRVRRFCRSLVGTRESREAGKRTWFDWFIVLSIIGSIVVVMVDTPLYRRNLRNAIPPKANIYPWLDAIFLFIFVAELLIRFCADGFLFTPQAYLLDPWNRVDLLIVLVLAVGFPINATSSGGLERAFRTTRATRPLRLINRFSSVRDIFYSTLSSVPNILYTAALSLLFVIPFAVYGVNVFAGYFAQCNDGSVQGQADCVGEFMTTPTDTSIGIMVPRVWSNPYQYSFDSFGSAMLLLFEMASTEGWIDVLTVGMAVPSQPGIQAQYSPDNASWYNSIFFCVFMLFGSIVVVQMFIGIIVETLRVRSGIALLTIDQQRWMDMQRRLKLIRPTAMPPRPRGNIRGWCYDISIDKRGRLAQFVNIITAANLVVMMTEHRHQPAWLDKTKDYIFTVLIVAYIAEVIIKLYGLGWRKWSKNRWNLFDLVVTLGAAITDFCIIFGISRLQMVQAQKLFLVAVALRLVQRIDSLQTLFKMLVASVPSILNVSVVLLLVLFVYSIILVELFSLTRFGPYTDELGSFRNFGNALLMLFRMSTGENWHYVMHDYMVEPPFCVGADDYLDTDCGSKYWSLFLFLSFYIIGTYILVNMFIVAVIDNFSYTYHRDIRASFVTRSDIRKFKRVWATFDPLATGYISVQELPRLLRSLTGNFSMRIYDDDHGIAELKRRALRTRRGPGGAEIVRPEAIVVDLRRINRALAAMDVTQVRRRRRRYNLVYQVTFGAGGHWTGMTLTCTISRY